MTTERSKKRGRPRKVKPIPTGDYAPKRAVSVRKKWYQKVLDWIKPKDEVRVTKTQIFLRRVLRLCFVYFSMGFTLAILFVLSLGEPRFISPISPSWGMERGYRIIPISHPEVVYAETEKSESPKVEVSEKIREVVEKYFKEKTDEALTCFKSESGLRPSAINYNNKNGTWDIGLAQINTVHCGKVNATDREDCKNKLLDLETNVRIAKQIYDGRGFNA